MATLHPVLSDPLYNNWIKAGLSLLFTKEGIEECVSNEISTFHQRVLNDVRQSTRSAPGPTTCNQCTTTSVTQGRACPVDICDRVKKRIEKSHRFHKPSWKNTDATKWCSDAWELAKCFMSPTGYCDVTSPGDTDFAGLVNVVINFVEFQNVIAEDLSQQQNIFVKARTMRNTIIHSSTFTISDGDLADYTDLLIQLLSDAKYLVTDKRTMTSLDKIKTLKTRCIRVTEEDEGKVLADAITSIKHEKEEALQQIDGHGSEQTRNICKEGKRAIADITSKGTKQTDRIDAAARLHSTALEVQKDDIIKILDAKEQTLTAYMDNLMREHVGILKSDKEKNTQMKHALQDELCKMYKTHMSTIAQSPLVEDIEAEIDDVFVDLKICDDLTHEPKRKQLSNEQLTSYKALFHRENETYKNVYIVGDAGIGKTTWCLKLLRTWVSYFNKQNQSTHVGNTILTEDEIALSEFDIVLYVSLRHASHWSDFHIRDMIKHQLFEENPQMEELLEQVLEQDSNKCLVILDGLDEWNAPKATCAAYRNPGLPGRKCMYNCTLITTTRPWKLDLLRLKNEEIDRAVKIQGLHEPNLLAEKVIERQSKKRYCDFRNHVQEKFYHHSFFKELPAMMEVPIILYFMICLWVDNGYLQSTLAANYGALVECLIHRAHGSRRSQRHERLSDVENLQTLKQNWAMSSCSLPLCLQNKPFCKQFCHLLLKLACLAFDTLCDKNKQSNLVFDEVLLLERFTEDEVEVAVKIGILSQSKVIGKTLIHMSSLAFLHKTLQEYLAALHIVCEATKGNMEPKSQYKSYCSSFDDIQEMEYVMLFICGMDPNIASELTKNIADVALIQERGSRELEYLSDDLPLKCIREIEADKHLHQSVPCINVYAYRIKIDALAAISNTLSRPLKLLKDNIKHLSHLEIGFLLHSKTKSFTIHEYEKRSKQIVNVLQNHLRHAERLSHLHLSSLKLDKSEVEWLPRALHELTELKLLELTAVDCRDAHGDSVPVKCDLLNCRNLQTFTCKSMAYFKFKVCPTRLENLNVNHTKMCFVTVSECEPKEGSPISVVNFNSAQSTVIMVATKSPLYIQLIQFQDCQECECIIEVSLSEPDKQRMTQKDEKEVQSCIKTLCCSNLTNCKAEFKVAVKSVTLKERNTGLIALDGQEIQLLEIDNVGLHARDASMATSVVRSMKNSKNLKCVKYVRMSEEGFEVLADVIPTLGQLHEFVLSNDIKSDTGRKSSETSIIESLQCIEKLKHLKCEYLTEGSFRTLSDTLHCLTHLETIELADNLSWENRHVIEALIHALAYLKSLKKLHYSDVRGYICHRKAAIKSIQALTQLEDLLLRWDPPLLWSETLDLRDLTFLKTVVLDGAYPMMTINQWDLFARGFPNTEHSLQVKLVGMVVDGETKKHIKSSLIFPTQDWTIIDKGYHVVLDTAQ